MPTDKGANAGLKVASLVAGMAAGADSIEDMALLRHGGMAAGADSIEDMALLRHGGWVGVFTRAYAPSTLGRS